MSSIIHPGPVIRTGNFDFRQKASVSFLDQAILGFSLSYTPVKEEEKMFFKFTKFPIIFTPFGYSLTRPIFIRVVFQN